MIEALVTYDAMKKMACSRESDKSDLLGERTEMEELRRAHGRRDRHWAGHCLVFSSRPNRTSPDMGLEGLEVLLLAQLLWRPSNKVVRQNKFLEGGHPADLHRHHLNFKIAWGISSTWFPERMRVSRVRIFPMCMPGSISQMSL
jgi:hypothetical protein